MRGLRLASVLLIALLMMTMNLGILAAEAPEIKMPNPTKEFYSNDFANILDSSTERDIVSLGESTFQSTEGGQIVFVSIDTLNESTIEEYSNELFNKWKIGTKDKGILFILSMQERESRIEVGYGYEGVLTDIESNKLLTKFAELYGQAGADEAVKTIYADICAIVRGEGAGVEYPENGQPQSQETGENNFFSENPILTIILGIIIVVLVVLDFVLTGGQVTFFILHMLAATARRGGGGGGGGNYGGGGRSGGGGSSSRF